MALRARTLRATPLAYVVLDARRAEPLNGPQWKKAARGTGEPPRSRSTATDEMPCGRGTSPSRDRRDSAGEQNWNLVDRILQGRSLMSEIIIVAAVTRIMLVTAFGTHKRFIARNAG